MVTATLLYNQGKALELLGLVKSQSFAHRNGPLIDNAPQKGPTETFFRPSKEEGGVTGHSAYVEKGNGQGKCGNIWKINECIKLSLDIYSYWSSYSFGFTRYTTTSVKVKHLLILHPFFTFGCLINSANFHWSHFIQWSEQMLQDLQFLLPLWLT